MKSKILTIVAITLLVYLGMWLGRIINESYWLIFCIWISMPVASAWVYNNLDSNNQVRMLIIKSINFTAIIFTLFNFGNYTLIREDIATKYIDGYKLTITHDCDQFIQESPFGDVIGEAPETCKVEDLARVSPASKVLLFIIKTIFLLLLIAIPLITLQGEKFYKIT